MKINKIILKNFQKHSYLELDFTDSINVITGESNAGKTAIKRAIAFVLFGSSVSIKDLIKEGSNETSVTLFLDNGFEVEKIRSSSVNRYILRKDGEEKVFDSVGKDIPEEVQKVIQVKPIDIENDSINLNIAEQIALPFLLDKSPSFRAKLFNKLTGNEAMDILFKSCNKESLSINKEIKSTEESLATQEQQIDEYILKHKNSKEKLLKVKEMYEKVKEQVKVYESLKEIKIKIDKNKEDLEFISFKISKIKIIDVKNIDNLKEKIQCLKEIKEVYFKLEVNKKQLKTVKEETSKIKVCDVDLEIIEKKIIDLGNLNTLKDKFKDLKLKRDLAEKKIKESENSLNILEKELHEVWEKCGDKCPLCKQEIKK